ncbi:Lrp/AsnC family transcriptional regulator [Pseudahrensia aquimaris]|uniref:Lrp/AsnC family transcriptional regulator n=1 Tax=Pseudahrensia aquimaris TaxID=744461 RepID=A0ABW3FFW7_9HYPH
MANALDAFDRKILASLQEDGRFTNAELADRVGLSASQCSRRRTALEDAGIINGYTARLDPEKVGIGLKSLVSVTLATHNDDNAANLRSLLARLPQVLDAYALTGEMDYMIKVVTPDLKALSEFINQTLLPHKAVQNVKTAIVLDTLKETSALPV